MADLTGSTATIATPPLDGTEKLLASDTGVDVVVTVRQVAAYVGDALGNESVAAQSPPAAATTYLIGSDILVPTTERVKVGTIFRWHGIVTKTAAGTLASSILVKCGINGSTADATLLTFALPAGTAVIDTGYLEINVTIRVIGATATLHGSLLFTHNLATTGLIIQNQSVEQATSGTFNSAVDVLRFGLAFTAGTSQAWTFQSLFGEAKNL
jgi:hypothetical protein